MSSATLPVPTVPHTFPVCSRYPLTRLDPPASSMTVPISARATAVGSQDPPSATMSGVEPDWRNRGHPQMLSELGGAGYVQTPQRIQPRLSPHPPGPTTVRCCRQRLRCWWSCAGGGHAPKSTSQRVRYRPQPHEQVQSGRSAQHNAKPRGERVGHMQVSCRGRQGVRVLPRTESRQRTLTLLFPRASASSKPVACESGRCSAARCAAVSPLCTW